MSTIDSESIGSGVSAPTAWIPARRSPTSTLYTLPRQSALTGLAEEGSNSALSESIPLVGCETRENQRGNSHCSNRLRTRDDRLSTGDHAIDKTVQFGHKGVGRRDG